MINMSQNVCTLFVLVLSLACGYKFRIQSLNLPSIDPLHVASIEIGEGSSAVNLVQKYKDVKVHGLSKIKVTNAHFDKGKKILKFTSVNPEIVQDANYDFNGKILVIPVYGKGHSNVTMENWTFNHTINFGEKTKNNKKYFTVTSYSLECSTTRAHFLFENLFNGDEKLSQTVHKVLNENWSVLIDDIKAGIALAYGDVLKLITDKFCQTVPADDIFLS